MKSRILFALFVLTSLLLACEQPGKGKIYNENLLSNRGEITLNTLAPRGGSNKLNVEIVFNGMIELTGVLEKRFIINYSRDKGGYVDWFFYPDRNLQLPYVSTFGGLGGFYDEKTDSFNYTKAKIEDFDEYFDFGIKLRNAFLMEDTKGYPHSMREGGKNFFGAEAIRVKIRLKGYQIVAHPECKMIAATPDKLVEVLSEKSVYYHKKGDGDKELLMKYASKDSYVNLREKPNGEIIAQIQAKDMIGDNPKAFIYPISFEDGWWKVFYLSPDAKDGRDAIRGFIHRTQVKEGHKP